MGPIGGASPALLNATLSIPSIVLNIGKTGSLKTSHYVIWGMFSSLDILAQVVAALTTEICLGIGE